MRSMSTLIAATVVGIASFAMPVSGALVVNGSFETEGTAATDSANWNELPSNGTNVVQRVAGNASAGSFAEELRAVGQTGIGTAATLQQLSNEAVPPGDVPTAGQKYTMSFDVKAVTFVGANLNYQFGFFVPGTGVTSIVAGDRNNLVGGAPYETIQIESNAAPVGATGFFIQFTAAAGADPSLEAHVFIDNVTVVPEPAAMSLVGVGAAGLLARRRRV